MNLAAPTRSVRALLTGLALAALTSGLLAACAAPRDSAPAASSEAVTPAPAAATSPASAHPTVTIDTACRTNADCTVKNVGNCCGYYPACVNVNSPADPQAVQAECARSGQMSVCGFREISACQCVQGQCAPAGGALEAR